MRDSGGWSIRACDALLQVNSSYFSSKWPEFMHPGFRVATLLLLSLIISISLCQELIHDRAYFRVIEITATRCPVNHLALLVDQ